MSNLVGIGSVSSARSPGASGSINFGNEKNTLDVISELNYFPNQLGESGLSVGLTGVAGGKFGIGILGLDIEYRQGISDWVDGERLGDIRVSPSFWGVKVRVTYDFDTKDWTVDVGTGFTVGIGSGVSFFGGVRAEEVFINEEFQLVIGSRCHADIVAHCGRSNNILCNMFVRREI